MTYEWRNIETGQVIDHDHYSEPPDDSGKWVRVFSVGINTSGGASPSRVSVKKEKK